MISSSSSNKTEKGRKFWVLGDTYTFHIKGAETDGQYAVLEISSPPGSGPPLHSHARESEGFYVIDGEFSFQSGDQKMVEKQGAFLHQKKGIPHTYKNIGKNVGRLLFTIIPAGFENFFAEVGISIEDEETFSPPSIDTIDITKIVTIAHEKYGLTVINPKDNQ
jgi:quercetin dioxygenase-like cupin family protein